MKADQMGVADGVWEGRGRGTCGRGVGRGVWEGRGEGRGRGSGIFHLSPEQ